MKSPVIFSLLAIIASVHLSAQSVESFLGVTLGKAVPKDLIDSSKPNPNGRSVEFIISPKFLPPPFQYGSVDVTKDEQLAFMIFGGVELKSEREWETQLEKMRSELERARGKLQHKVDTENNTEEWSVNIPVLKSSIYLRGHKNQLRITLTYVLWSVWATTEKDFVVKTLKRKMLERIPGAFGLKLGESIDQKYILSHSSAKGGLIQMVVHPPKPVKPFTGYETGITSSDRKIWMIMGKVEEKDEDKLMEIFQQLKTEITSKYGPLEDQSDLHGVKETWTYFEAPPRTVSVVLEKKNRIVAVIYSDWEIQGLKRIHKSKVIEDSFKFDSRVLQPQSKD